MQLSYEIFDSLIESFFLFSFFFDDSKNGCLLHDDRLR